MYDKTYTIELHSTTAVLRYVVSTFVDEVIQEPVVTEHNAAHLREELTATWLRHILFVFNQTGDSQAHFLFQIGTLR